MNLRDHDKRYMGGFGQTKSKGVMLELNYNYTIFNLWKYRLSDVVLPPF